MPYQPPSLSQQSSLFDAAPVDPALAPAAVMQGISARAWRDQVAHAATPETTSMVWLLAALEAPTVALREACWAQVQGVSVEEAAVVAFDHRQVDFLTWLRDTQQWDPMATYYRHTSLDVAHLGALESQQLVMGRDATREWVGKERARQHGAAQRKAEHTLWGVALHTLDPRQETDAALLAVLFTPQPGDAPGLPQRCDTHDSPNATLPQTPKGVYPLAYALGCHRLAAAEWLLEHLGWPPTAAGKAQCLTAALDGLEGAAQAPLTRRYGLQEQDQARREQQGHMEQQAQWVDRCVAAGASWRHPWKNKARHPHEPDGSDYFLAFDQRSPWIDLGRHLIFNTVPDDRWPDSVLEQQLPRWAHAAATTPCPTQPSVPAWFEWFCQQHDGHPVYEQGLGAAMDAAPAFAVADATRLYALAFRHDMDDRHFKGCRMQALTHHCPDGLAPLTPTLARELLVQQREALVKDVTTSSSPELTAHFWNRVRAWDVQWSTEEQDRWRTAIDELAHLHAQGTQPRQDPEAVQACEQALNLALDLLVAPAPEPTRPRARL